MKGSSGSCRSGAVVLGVTVCLLASAAFGGSENLANGVPVVGISGAAGSEQFYTIVVPAGQDDLVICISGGTGDCDLYVRKDVKPTTTAYDYRPYKMGNEESVTVRSPQAGTWHVMLRGFTDYSGLTLKCTYSSSAVATPLTNGIAVAGLSGAADSEKFYRLTVPVNRSRLEIAISGGTGDCDLYVKKDALPTTDVYDYRPFLLGNGESVIVHDPGAGTWYIMLKGYRAYANVTLVASSLGAAVGEPAYSAVAIAGNGGLAVEGCGWRPYIYPPDTSIATGLWPEVVAEDPAGGGSTLVSGSHQMEWMLDYAPSTDSATTVTASFTVSPSLFAGSSGDSASADYVVKLELLSWIGTPIDSDEVHPASITVANGADFSDPVTVSVSVVTPDRMIDGSNNSILRLTASAAAEAFTSGLPDQPGDGGVTTLANGVPVGGLAGTAGSETYYRVEVPSGQSKLQISVSGGTGDVDLYVRRNAKPTTTDWDCRPYLIGNDETVAINNPKSGTYYILLKGAESYSGTTLRAFFGDAKQQTH